MGELRHQTVVITGASSGMGLATALAFSRRGANLVLCARRAEPLAQAARDCERLGGRAVAVPSDVCDAAQMRTLADTATRAYGQIDVWINNAGLSLWGAFADIPLEAQARLIEVNLLGTINGAHAAVSAMLAGSGRGVIINMASVGGRLPMPFASTYSASKYGVRGFTEALRYELAAISDIAVCAVYPGFVDTPTNVHSANFTGRTLRPVPPVIDPNRVAEAIVALARRPKRAVHIGAHHGFAGPYALAPELSGRALGHLARRFLLQSGAHAADFTGTLFEPVREGTGVRGGWGQPERRRFKQAALAAVVGLVCISALAAGALRARR